MNGLVRTIEQIADAGVPVTMPASTAKHVRFCNLGGATGCLFAIVFWFVEMPVIGDGAGSVPRELAIILGRGIGALLFLLPLWLNARRLYRASRLVLIAVALLYELSSSVIFGNGAPSHLFVIVITSVALAIFPEEERSRMWGVVAACALAFATILWLRTTNQPLVSVISPVTRVALELSISFGALLLAVVITFVLRSTARRAESQAIHEQERADRLLLNILPDQIARRLKDDPQSIADGFHDVTVLFADLVGFTPMAEKMSPRETLKLMDEVFSRFDALVDRFGLEKIKTVGDAYMLAGGLPAPTESHAEDVAGMALAMLEDVRQVLGPDGVPLSIRIGIATGPVVAGVIGRKKFLYDLWGDTVNTASRMESTSEPNTIQVSEFTWRRLRGRFKFRERGEIEIKGKGRVMTWFLEGRLGS